MTVIWLAEGGEWWTHLEQLLPIILVVAVGLLTLIKRGVELLLKRRGEQQRSRPPGSPSAGPATETEAGTSVFEEMKRYFEMLEGRSAAGPAPPAQREPAAPRRPARVPTPAPRPAAPAEPTRFHDLAHLAPTAPPHLPTHIAPESRPTRALPPVRPLRGLPRVRLRSDRMSLRAAFLWREILGPGRHERPF